MYLLMNQKTSLYIETLNEKWWILKNERKCLSNLKKRIITETQMKSQWSKTECFLLNFLILSKILKSVQTSIQRCLLTMFQWCDQRFIMKFLLFFLILILTEKENKNQKRFKTLTLKCLFRNFVIKISQWLMIQSIKSHQNLKLLKNKSMFSQKSLTEQRLSLLERKTRRQNYKFFLKLRISFRVFNQIKRM